MPFRFTGDIEKVVIDLKPTKDAATAQAVREQEARASLEALQD